MKELRIDIGGSTRGFKAATEDAIRTARRLQKELGNDPLGGFDFMANAKKVAGTPTGMLKRGLAEISAISPVAGMAMRMAFSPIAGIIGLSVAALSDFKNAQNIAAEESKVAAQKMRDAWMDAYEAIYSKDPSKEFGKKAKEEAAASVRAGVDVTDETKEGWFSRRFKFFGGIRKRAGYVSDSSGLSHLLGDKTEQEKVEDLSAMRERVARATALSALRRTQNAERKSEEKKAADEKAKKDAADRVRLEKELTDELTKQAPLEERIGILKRDANKLDNERFRAQMAGDENGRLTAQIGYLRKKKELEAAQAELAKKNKPPELAEKQMSHIDSLSSMGLITSLGAMTNPLIDVSRRQLVKLTDIHNVLKGNKDIYAP
jgi:hypothetical protein